VDLVHREGIGAEADCRCAGEGEAPALRQLLNETGADAGISPVPQRIGWAAGPGEDVIGAVNAAQELFDLQRGRAPAVTERRDPDLRSNMPAELGEDAGRNLVGVPLAAEGPID